MKIAVIGSRNFRDYDLLKRTLDDIDITVIISGGVKGADALGEKYAEEHQIPTMVFRPDWKRFGRRAGPVRNSTIVENADCVIAFWDGVSKGTQSSINIAKRFNKPLQIVTIEQS